MHVGVEDRAMGRWPCCVRGLVALFLVAVIGGCSKPESRPERSPDIVLRPLGRIFPNLATHDDHQKGTEFLVQLEIGLKPSLKPISEADIAKIQSILRNPTVDGLLVVESLVTPLMGENGKPPRQAFREMVHCAFVDNIEQMKGNPTEPSCPDTW